MNRLERKIFESIDEEIYNARNACNTNPTEGQKKAGNYKMGHVKINGYTITIENPKGSHRRGVDKNGKPWDTLMHNDYGYFTRTKGKDGDAIDVFIGNDLESTKIFAVDQKVGGKFDETKIMFCFNTIEQAKEAYMSNYEKDWKGFWKITPVTPSVFKKWLYDGYRQRKPFFKYVDIIKDNKNTKDNMKKRAIKEDALDRIIKRNINEACNEMNDNQIRTIKNTLKAIGGTIGFAALVSMANALERENEKEMQGDNEPETIGVGVNLGNAYYKDGTSVSDPNVYDPSIRKSVDEAVRRTFRKYLG